MMVKIKYTHQQFSSESEIKHVQFVQNKAISLPWINLGAKLLKPAARSDIIPNEWKKK